MPYVPVLFDQGDPANEWLQSLNDYVFPSALMETIGAYDANPDETDMVSDRYDDIPHYAGESWWPLTVRVGGLKYEVIWHRGLSYVAVYREAIDA